MEGKNLSLKFAFLVVIVAVCLWSLLFGNGLKQGIDLSGGHSLVFQIRSNEADRLQLLSIKREREAELETAQSEEEKQELIEAIDRIDERLAGLPQDPPDLVERTIAILKARVDPDGLLNLEWRPLGKYRFSVRMPAGSQESRELRKKYDLALNRLRTRNLRRSQIARVEQLGSGPRREAQIVELAQEDQGLATKLRALGKAYDATLVAKNSGDENTYQNALNQWEEKREAVNAFNISPQRLQAVLGNYVSPAETKALKEKETELNRRREAFEQSLNALLAEYPTRRDEIESVVSTYKAWTKVRQFLDDPGDLQRLVSKVGVLEFRIAPQIEGVGQGQNITEQQWQQYVGELLEHGPEFARKRGKQYQWFPLASERASYNTSLIVEEYAGRKYMLLCDESEHTMLQRRNQGGWSLKSARVAPDDLGMPAVRFTLDERGAKRFGTITMGHQGQFMAVLLDDEVYSAPVIKSVISKQGIIQGDFSSIEARELARTLEAGSLPARLNSEPVSRSTFGPALGKVNRDRGKTAAVAGLIAVAVFMLLYYLLNGFIADLALLLNIILVLGAMSMMTAVFTLPGIAGLILTIGIAVDANVLIFERLREEQGRGQSVRMAIKNAYERAFSAIFDANVTTLITCLILFWVGREDIRGFAITLGLGVTFSMFTALVVTRWVFQLLLSLGLLKKPVFMLHVIGTPKVNWMAKRKVFWVLSIVLIGVGIASMVAQGENILGIDFSSGTKAIVHFKDGTLIDGKLLNDARVREKINEIATAKGYDRLKSTARVEEIINPYQAEVFSDQYDQNKDGRVDLQEWQAARGNETFFAAMDSNADGSLDVQELDTLPASSYQIATSESKMSLIRSTVEEAFSDSLKRRRSCTFDLVKSRRELGVDIADNGLSQVRASDDAQPRDLHQDFAGGVVMVIENVSPVLTVEQCKVRINDMRHQPDFAAQQTYQTEVIGLADAREGKYSSFAVFVYPDDENIVSKADAWERFAETELDLLTQALGRSEAMEASNFDKAVADETAQLAVVAVVLSWLAIVGYLWLRFGSIQWGLAAVVCLVHDVVIVVGLVAASDWLQATVVGQWLGISSFKIDLAMIAAILTVIGYSVNDTIVVFDRIRENRGKLSTVSAQVINTSINQTLGRTLLTSGTTFIVVLIMYVWGGAGIHAFNYALLAGIIFGTYSSIAVASPLLLGFKQALVTKIAAVTED